ncbi:hypothetical protein PQR05_20820 [Paraburkholderia sediminicola]|uniref:VOC domain-containing protein n=1 Tax=Paraburkholderia metrosideri TaxID=580937 RepID=A0ABW9DYI1_9BURK
MALNVDDLHAALPYLAQYGRHAQGSPQTVSAGPHAGALILCVAGPDGATTELRRPSA